MKLHAIQKKIYSYLKRNIIWAATSYSMFWCSVIPLAYSLFIIHHSGYNEYIIRLYGLALQLGGIGTVAYGIHKTRVLFGLPRTFEFLKQSLKSRPRYKQVGRPYSITHDLVAQTLVIGSPVLGQPKLTINPTIEDRIKLLENHISSLNNHINEIKNEMVNINKKHLDDIFDERKDRKKEYEQLKNILEKVETGGLHISTMGTIWLVVGTIFCTVSNELNNLLS